MKPRPWALIVVVLVGACASPPSPPSEAHVVTAVLDAARERSWYTCSEGRVVWAQAQATSEYAIFVEASCVYYAAPETPGSKPEAIPVYDARFEALFKHTEDARWAMTDWTDASILQKGIEREDGSFVADPPKR